jgi:hypothetical protein
MFLGSLLSGYVLIRAGSTAWPMHAGNLATTVIGGSLLLVGALACRPSRGPLWAAALAAAAVVIWLARLHGAAFAAGQTPGLHLEFASWFTITGVLLVLIALLAVSAAATALGDNTKVRPRAAGLRVMFGAMSILWFVTLSVFSGA